MTQVSFLPSSDRCAPCFWTSFPTSSTTFFPIRPTAQPLRLLHRLRPKLHCCPRPVKNSLSAFASCSLAPILQPLVAALQALLPVCFWGIAAAAAVMAQMTKRRRRRFQASRLSCSALAENGALALPPQRVIAMAAAAAMATSTRK